MRGKLIIHYFVTFILACLIIFAINIVFMRENIYGAGALYNYEPEQLVTTFRNYIYLTEDNKVEVNKEGMDLLNSDNIGLQILDEDNKEVFQYEKPATAPSYYSNVSLIDM